MTCQSRGAPKVITRYAKRTKSPSLAATSQSRIVLLVVRRTNVIFPSAALVVVVVRARQHHRVGRLQELHAQALADVPRDVAVHEPGARVVGVESDGEPTRGRHGSGVAARRRVEVERARLAGVVGAAAGAEDEEVVAVQVDGVRRGWQAVELLDEPVVPAAFVTSGHDVDGLGVARVVVHDIGYGRIGPVDVDGLVEGPDNDGGAVGNDNGLSDVDVHVLELRGKVAAWNGLVPVWGQGAWSVAGRGFCESTRRACQY